MQQIMSATPWYRQIWPWLILLPPAFAVIGGFTTLYLVLRHPDPEVCGDYRRDGFGTYPTTAQSEQRQISGCR